MPVEQAAGATDRRVGDAPRSARPAGRGHRAVARAWRRRDGGRARCARATRTWRGARSTAAVDPASPDFLNFTRDRPAARGRRVPRAGPAARARAQLARGARRHGRRATSSPRSSRRARSPRASTTGCCSPRWSKPGCRCSARGRISMRVDYALRQHDQWYKGDGAYGDGPAFHWDYYNSFVIHPMLLDVLDVFRDKLAAWKELGVARRGARAALRRRPGTADRARRQLPADRPLARLPLRRVPAAGADGAAARAARRRLAGAGPRRADRRHPPDARSARHVRRERLAAHRLLRPPARRRRVVHFHRQPVLCARSALLPLGLARRGRVLVGAAAAVDLGARLVRSADFPSITRLASARLPASTRLPIPDPRSPIPVPSYTSRMAVRRGVWVVIVLIVFAVSISAIGHAADVQRRRPRAAGRQQLDAGAAHRRRPERDGPRRRARAVHRRRRRPSAAIVEMLRKAKTDKRITSVILKPTGSGRAVGQGPGSARRGRSTSADPASRSSPTSNTAASRSSTSRRRATRSS